MSRSLSWKKKKKKKSITYLRMGDDGLTVQTNKPLSQPTTNTDPDRGLNFKNNNLRIKYIETIIRKKFTTHTVYLYCTSKSNPSNPYTIMNFLHIVFMQFLRCWQGEFVLQSKASLVGDHFLFCSWP